MFLVPPLQVDKRISVHFEGAKGQLLRARCAFVTFTSERAYHRCVVAYGAKKTGR